MKLSRNLHIYISLFFLPLALLYALTGALFIFGIDAEFGAKYQHYTLENTEIEKGQETNAILSFLQKNNISLPLDDAIDNKDENVIISIGSVYYNASLKPIDTNNYEIIVQTRSILGVLMSLHEAKDAAIFDVLAIGFALTLLILYITGVIITLINGPKKKRPNQYIAICAGVFVFGLAVLSKILWGI